MWSFEPADEFNSANLGFKAALCLFIFFPRKALKRLRKKRRKTDLAEALSPASLAAAMGPQEAPASSLEVGQQTSKKSKRRRDVEEQPEEEAEAASASKRLNTGQQEANEKKYTRKPEEEEKRAQRKYKQPKQPHLSEERLRAAGIDPKQFKYSRKRKQHPPRV